MSSEETSPDPEDICFTDVDDDEFDINEYAHYLLNVHSAFWSLKGSHESIVDSLTEELKAWKNKYQNAAKQLESVTSSLTLYENALQNRHLDDEEMMYEVQLLFNSNMNYYGDPQLFYQCTEQLEQTQNELKQRIEDSIIYETKNQRNYNGSIIIIIICIILKVNKRITSFICFMIQFVQTLTFRKIRKHFRNKESKLRKFTSKQYLKQWLFNRLCVAFVIRKKRKLCCWIEVNTLNHIDCNKWIIKICDIHNRIWYNWLNITLQMYIDYVYHIISIVLEYITCYFCHYMMMKNKYHEMEEKLFLFESKYLDLEEEKESVCLSMQSMIQRINELSSDIDCVYDEYEMDISQRNKEILKLKEDNKILKNDLNIQYKENKSLIKMVNEEEYIREELRKKKNELRNIKGNNNYLLWNSDDIVDWMIIQEKGRYRCYENVLRSSLKIECISGSLFDKLSVSDLYRLGIKHFEDKKCMLRLIKDLVKNCISKKEDPEELCDPITFELMKDPMIVVSSGRTYEKKTIKSIIKKGDKEPFSGHKISNKHLIPNKLVKELITKYKQCKVIIHQ